MSDEPSEDGEGEERGIIKSAVDGVSDLARNYTFGLGVGFANQLDSMTERHAEGGAGGTIDHDLP